MSKIRMQDIVKLERVKTRVFKISWKMTDWCNYRCSYCYMANAVAKGKHTSQETVEQIASKIDKLIEIQAKDKDYIELHLIGGEVCYYDLISVLDKIKSKIVQVIVATNFSRSIDYWKGLKQYCESRGIVLNIIASFHLEQCDPKEYMAKAIQMNAKIKAVVNDNNLELYKPYFETALKFGLIVQCTVERDSMNSCETSITNPKSQAYVDFLNKDQSKKAKPYYIVTLADNTQHVFYSNIELINSIDVGGLDTEGFLCTAGLDGIRITQNGTLQRAGCRFCASKFGAGKIGNILDEDIWSKFPITEPIECHSSLPDELIDENGNKTGLPDYTKMVKKYCTCFINANMYRS